MEEMSAFERQLAARLQQMVGPEPFVDVTASVRAATTAVPKTRLLTMFGATRFVLAGAMVALFGGLLLAGVVTTQQADEPPPVGASPSPQATDDPLSSLETEEIVPGVLRVDGDVTGRDLGGLVAATVVADDGSVWMGGGSRVFELGQVGDHRQNVGQLGDQGHLAVGTDGTLWAVGSDPSRDMASFDGQTWTQRNGSPREATSGPDPWWPSDYLTDFVVHPDGTVWQIGEMRGGDAHTSLQHLGPNGWAVYRIGDGLPSLGCAQRCDGGWSLAITPDGTVWVSVAKGGLLRFDGTEWGVVRPLGGDVDYGVTSLAANRDGILWAEVQTDADLDGPGERLEVGRHLARFDGEEWEVFYPPNTPDFLDESDGEHPGPRWIQAVGPDGSVWLTDTVEVPGADGERQPIPVRFDGQRWARYPEPLEHWLATEALADVERRSHVDFAWDISTGPDGNAWAHLNAWTRNRSFSRLYVITPEAVVATD